ncbi:MAG TPA: hypothetical protein VK699_10500 [Terriglobales bacterium]|jgi:hypothetical protein|nr:hypothetical protein [Terriglobales bacterium]
MVAGLIFVLISALAPGFAQTSEPENKIPAKDLIATITYTVDWHGAQPSHYSIKLDSAGHATYESLPSATTDASDKYESQFVMSADLRDRIFALAQKANYFDGKFDYTKRKIASTGQKTLEYTDGSRHFQTAYNWSENPSIQELTDIFYGISNTMESGSKLEYLKRFDKLGLPEELLNMLRMRSEGHLLEIQSIAPVLRQIAQDSSQMNLARQRAQQLMDGQ